MEWKNQFNSFNSWKGLLYQDWYKAIAAGEFKPPVEASLDPIHACNIHCGHCNASRYIKSANRMPDQHLMKLIEFLWAWGVKAVCFGGGGEPTLHTGLEEAIRLTVSHGMEASVATNGTVFTDELVDALALCRWVGVSVDAASRDTYVKYKHKDLFDKVIGNIVKLVKKSDKCDVAYKFLIMPYNQDEIFYACWMAKELGVKDFHARPADYRHQGMGKLKRKANEFNIELIKEQFERCHELETEDFRVFTVMHKFNTDFTPRKDFSQCYAAPLCIQLCADGNVYHCVDQRHSEDYLLGSHYPNPWDITGFWGGERHKELVFKTGRDKCNTRCTFGVYCKQCEELFIKKHDPMCKWFT